MSTEITPRERWGPLAQASENLVAIDFRLGLLIVHHTDTAAPANERQAYSLLRSIDRFHYYTRGWSGGAGYNFAVTPWGEIIEVRGEHSGAHTVGHNDRPAVALLGDYASTVPPLPMRQAVWRLADYVSATRLAGHRDFNSTTCPGQAAYDGLVRARRPHTPSPAEVRRQALDALPGGATLRLSIHNDGPRPRAFAGWRECAGPMKWIALCGLDSSVSDAHAIAWRGAVWRGADDVTNVCRNLVRRFL